MTNFSSLFDKIASTVAAIAVATMFVVAAIGPAALPIA